MNKLFKTIMIIIVTVAFIGCTSSFMKPIKSCQTNEERTVVIATILSQDPTTLTDKNIRELGEYLISLPVEDQFEILMPISLKMLDCFLNSSGFKPCDNLIINSSRLNQMFRFGK